MNDLKTELKGDLDKSLTALQTLRDEIRVRLHLAGMEVKDAWNHLEPKFVEAEKLAQDVSETSRTAVHDIVKSFQEFRASLP